MDNNFQLASAAISDIGLNEKRPQNEDSYLELSERGVFAVADGVGGAQAGDVASQMAVELLGEAFVNFRDGGDAEEIMKLAIGRANSAIYQMSHDLPQLSTMATTLVSLHISGNIATIGHVGDSRMYRLDPNGSLFRETQDHSIVEEEVRAGRMTAEQAANHPSRNVISRALGAEPGVEIDMKTIMFEPNTCFLLCSDGITRHINDFEIRELLALNTTPSDICERMKRICYERGAEDNLTAVIVKVLNEPARAFAPQENVLLDLDEPTVATARPPETPQVDEVASINDYDEMETRELEMPAHLGAEAPGSTIDLQPEAPAPAEIAPPPPPPPPSAVEAPAQPVGDYYSMFGADTSETVEKTSSGGGTLGKVLSGLIMLVLGAILGVVAYSFIVPRQAPAPETPPVLEPKSKNFEFTGFEDSRREVDKDPAKFLAQGTFPRDATDYYLHGRANLLTGDYVKARAAFVEAKNRAQEIPEINRKPILNDIAMAMAILNNTFTQKALADDLSKNGSASNSNTAPSGNANTNK